ncbi:heavy-metal-associated domain-containing protein [Bacteroidota bacterium]
MKLKKFKIEGMACEHCVRAIKQELSTLNLDYYEVEIGLANIRYDEKLIQDIEITKAIEEAGYRASEELI